MEQLRITCIEVNERVKYNMDRSKETKMVGNLASQVEKTNKCTD